MNRTLIFSLFSALLLITPALAANNQTDWDTFTISTYYPSPYGVYNRLEAKKALSIGGFTGAPAGVGSIFDLSDGQLFVGESQILKGVSSDPLPAKAGQVIYNSAQGMLKFYDSSAWVNATCSSCQANMPCAACPSGAPMCYANCTFGQPCNACPLGQRCYRPNTADSCPGGQTCQGACPTCQTGQPCSACPVGQQCFIPNSSGSCPAGQICQIPQPSILILQGPGTCPAPYTYLVSHWLAKTCTGLCQTHPAQNWKCCPYSSCTTPAAWASTAPTCGYANGCWGPKASCLNCAATCTADSIDQTICVKN